MSGVCCRIPQCYLLINIRLALNLGFEYVHCNVM